MNVTDQNKICSAGFIIIRFHEMGKLDTSVPAIYEKTIEKLEWHLLEKGFKSKAACLRRMEEMLKNPIVIQD